MTARRGPTNGRARRVLLLAMLLAAPAQAQAQDPEATLLDCLVQPQSRVLLSAPIEGVVSSVLVERGDPVEAGQIVATLESSVEEAIVAAARAGADFDAELQASEARLAFEQRRWEQMRELFSEGVSSDRERDEAESTRLVAEANTERARENQVRARLELQRAEAMLERRQVRSPIDGIVVKRLVSPGEYVDPPRILEIAQIDPLRVEAFAPVSLFGHVAKGMRGEVVLEQPLQGSYEARVVIVDTVVDAASRTFGIRLELPNPDHSIPAGVDCHVRFTDVAD